MFDLEGKCCVITGGSSGIGKAIAQRFLGAGAKVMVGDLQPPQGFDHSSLLYSRTDVGQLSDVRLLLDEAVAQFGALDVLVNNAGIGVLGGLADTGSAAAGRLHEINTLGVLHGMREGARRMKAGGVIINMSSVAGVIAMPGVMEYSMSKAAIIQATRTAALDLGILGIRVNAICPGQIDTPLVQSTGAPIAKTAKLVTPLGRVGTPEEVAALAHFLASDDSSYVTGQAICVDGGWSCGTTAQTMHAAIAEGR